ncbi:hypothetical protein GCM10010923_19080 [Blastomonas marina]|uniref:Uncharacterized protein n=2 Tax=Blastomonas marina TaxID=1867408 RepID=A0ABQ1FF62_9SPHN|nr:hypothetical protein GCM10010923_19080 [Blastomonas marina]
MLGRSRTVNYRLDLTKSGLSANDPVAAIGCLRDGAPMKAVFYAIALVTGAACSQEQASEQELIMRAIESAVQLPAAAEPLEEYSRNYALRPDGKVIGVYVLPSPAEARVGDVGCEVMLENFESRPCTDAEEEEIAGREKATADLFGQANQSRWFDNHRDLPMMDDGGCNLIVIIFDPQSQLIQSTKCNGEA